MGNPAPKNHGSTPEAFDGKPIDAENFWTALESYYWLNNDVYANKNEKVSAALTHFKVGTPPVNGPGNAKRPPLQRTLRTLALGLSSKKSSQPTSSLLT